MPLLSISSKTNDRRGFTLLEILIVLAILGVIFTLGVFTTFDAYRGYSFRAERYRVVSLLDTVRSRAMGNEQGSAWGICYLAPQYVLFEGRVCASSLASNESVPANGTASVVAFPTIVFSQVTGTTSGGTIVLTQDWRIATITVNYEGTINW